MKLAHDVETFQEIKKSKFYCLLRRVNSEAEFKEFLKEVKKKYPQATHYCTAWSIGSQMRSSDDGEPSGTAGRPMLDVLAGSKAEDIGAVVVRYFGGTLLGKGGLVRAYSSSVRQALDEAEFLKTKPMKFFQIRFGYELLGKIDGFLHANSLQKTEEEYGEQVVYYVLSESDISDAIAALSSGKAQVLFLKEISMESPA